MYTFAMIIVWIVQIGLILAMVGHTALCVLNMIYPPKDWTGPL